MRRLECEKLIGVRNERGGTVYATTCGRFRLHLGACREMTRRNFVQVFYGINRKTWPEMSRRAALLDAWRASRGCSASGGPTDG